MINIKQLTSHAASVLLVLSIGAAQPTFAKSDDAAFPLRTSPMDDVQAPADSETPVSLKLDLAQVPKPTTRVQRADLFPTADTSSNSLEARSFGDARRQLAVGDAVSLGGFQDQPSPTTSEDGPVDNADKTGTNPINFTFEFKVYNEYLWLNTAGDGSQNLTTVEFRAPFADGKWQFRVRARANWIEADLNNDGTDDLDDSGFGDVDFRFLTVPHLDMSKRIAVAVGLEIFLDTASDDALGSGSTSLGPQIFLVLFKPFGLDLDLFAPAYQHKFSIDGKDVNQSLIDLFILKTSEDKSLWALVDPAFVIDHEANTEYMLIDIELGTMLDKYLGTKGHSAYVRPSVGIGGDRPYDASIEVGYKIVF